MSTEENKAVVREILAALDRSDWAAIEQHPGMAQTRRVHPMIHTVFPDYHHTIEQEMADGDMVAVRATARGTHQGTFMGMASTWKEHRHAAGRPWSGRGRLPGPRANSDELG
jgi:predicted ester cyclase